MRKVEEVIVDVRVNYFWYNRERKKRERYIQKKKRDECSRE